ncbi:MAG: helix-turn-helix transcriptional regulator [Campylobacteraceae bacterium]|nr:helix-turn-helix transcriptional regulator [Campylobacteraceae bacterium]
MGYFNQNLDALDFKLFEPHALLKPYIHSYWFVRKKEFNQEIIYKVLSDASMGFAINFASPYSSKINNNTFPCAQRFTIDGPTKHPTYLCFEKELYIIGVRFKTAGAYVFFEEEMESFLDKNTPLQNSKSWPLDNLYDVLITKNSVEERIKLIEDFLMSKLQKSKKKNAPWIFAFIQKVLTNKGDISLESLCDEFDISNRQIERTFKKEVGISPKIFIRIIRMRNAKDILSRLEVESLTKTAHETGFFDQAHFTREFKFFMRETPKNYYKNKRSLIELSNFQTYSKK